MLIGIGYGNEAHGLPSLPRIMFFGNLLTGAGAFPVELESVPASRVSSAIVISRNDHNLGWNLEEKNVEMLKLSGFVNANAVFSAASADATRGLHGILTFS